MKTYEELILELDDNQRAASQIDTNAVIAAGAGSGKTRVLAARFVYLIIEKEIPVDEILALTFTKKAASEMYTRIYSTLCEIDHPAAREAIASFHLARIDTIDSFCNSITRTACRQYGVSPDFDIDNNKAMELASELALPFFLENRRKSAIRQFMKKYSLSELSTALFADTVVRYSPISKPLDFPAFRILQKKIIEERFPKAAEEIIRLMHSVSNLPKAKGKIQEQVSLVLETLPDMPEIENRTTITTFISLCSKLSAIRLPGNVSDPTLVEMKELLSSFKNELFPEFLSLANSVLNDSFVEETFSMLSEFQTLFHQKKRAAGLMTFADISQLAVDALTNDCALRSAYKNSISAIMIDEFQDDNALQRNLFFLIAEKKDRTVLSVPDASELCPDKLFFVGDEKQSIYRFRGADVSVFRELSSDLGCTESPSLGTNYRTEAPLLDIFNQVFPFVFLRTDFYTGDTFPLYEAAFTPILSSCNTPNVVSSLDILLVNEAMFSDTESTRLGKEDTEAAEVAERIRMLVESGTLVRGKKNGKDEAKKCTYDDIAILFRSGTKQHYFEKHLRENNIPYQAESLRGLFSDAPINDMYALLRLAVFPADNTAYAILLRSPFVTLSDKGFILALIHRTENSESNDTLNIPFSEEIDALLDDEDRTRFQRGRELYHSVREKADRIHASEIITSLWYDEGYRYAILSEKDLHRYAELYDYFFELARQSDAKGETLATFLDRIAYLMSSGDKIDGLDIPVERSGGVKLMTVHKSKGLEFPVVFLVDCGNEGRADTNSAPVYFSPISGISVNTGGADGAENARSNYFYELGREEEKNKAQAEIRRLLYVAMTRAETRLIISGLIKLGGESGDESRTEEALRSDICERLDKKDAAAQKAGKSVQKRSFFDFLLPAFTLAELNGVTITEIVPRERKNFSNGQKLSADEITRISEAQYETAEIATYESSPRTRYSATSLQDIPNQNLNQIKSEPDSLDLFLKTLGIPANEFGTYAHKAIEERFTGITAFMPEEIKTKVSEMVDRFMTSQLGIQAQKALWRQNEYGFITHYQYNSEKITVTGQMDLVYEYENTVYIIDYKTDKVENPALHAEQLSVYRKAALDLWKKDVQSWLFYLRTGNSVRI